MHVFILTYVVYIFCCSDSSHFNSTLDDLSKLDSSKTSKKTNRQSVSRGELIISLSKTKEGEKERGQMEKEAGSVAGKKEKEKPEIEAQLCGEFDFPIFSCKIAVLRIDISITQNLPGTV